MRSVITSTAKEKYRLATWATASRWVEHSPKHQNVRSVGFSSGILQYIPGVNHACILEHDVKFEMTHPMNIFINQSAEWM